MIKRIDINSTLDWAEAIPLLLFGYELVEEFILGLASASASSSSWFGTEGEKNNRLFAKYARKKIAKQTNDLLTKYGPRVMKVFQHCKDSGMTSLQFRITQKRSIRKLKEISKQ
jgi:hypothetical protein